jgi:hypothetical protein
MHGSTVPRTALLPDKRIPLDPNSSFAANFDPARRQIAPLRPITPAFPTEEIEEKEICQPKFVVGCSFKTVFV